MVFIRIKHKYLLRERVDSFYENKTEYLLREIKYLLRERISYERESWVVVIKIKSK